jgi:hypothetical protein
MVGAVGTLDLGELTVRRAFVSKQKTYKKENP